METYNVVEALTNYIKLLEKYTTNRHFAYIKGIKKTDIQKIKEEIKFQKERLNKINEIKNFN